MGSSSTRIILRNILVDMVGSGLILPYFALINGGTERISSSCRPANGLILRFGMIGGLPTGIFSDKHQRKRALAMTSLVSFPGYLLLGFSGASPIRRPPRPS